MAIIDLQVLYLKYNFGYEKFQLSRDFETCLGAKPTERKKKGALVHLVHT